MKKQLIKISLLSMMVIGTLFILYNTNESAQFISKKNKVQ